MDATSYVTSNDYGVNYNKTLLNPRSTHLGPLFHVGIGCHLQDILRGPLSIALDDIHHIRPTTADSPQRRTPRQILAAAALIGFRDFKKSGKSWIT